MVKQLLKNTRFIDDMVESMMRLNKNGVEKVIKEDIINKEEEETDLTKDLH